MANTFRAGFLRDDTGALVVAAGSAGGAASVNRGGVSRGMQIGAGHNFDSSSTVTTVGGSTNDTHQSRIRHPVHKDAAFIALGYINWHGETPGANAITVAGAVESPAATFLPVTFAGDASRVLAPDGYFVSDLIPTDVLAGADVYSRTRVTFTAGGTAPEIRTTATADGEGSETGVGLASKLTSGTITAGVTYAYGPALVLSIAADGTVLHSVGVLGDSIVNGQTDYSFDKSWVSRLLDTAGVGYVNLAVNGEAATTYAAPATSRRRRLLTGGLDTTIVAYGTNDVISGATLATIQGRLMTIASSERRAGKRVFIPTLMPLTDSSDGFTTLGNQTPRAVDTVRRQLNQWMRDGFPIDATTKVAVAVGTSANALRAGDTGHPVAKLAGHPTLALGYLEVADSVESARDSGKWKITGASGVGDTTSASNQITNFTGTGFAVGQVLVATGIPNGAFANGIPVIDSGVGTATLVLKGVSGTSTNANATAAGVTIKSAYTQDGTHPWPAMHIQVATDLASAGAALKA